jgi:hypothetical protein
MIYWNTYAKRVSKPSIFLTSQLLIFSTSFFLSGPIQHLQKLSIKKPLCNFVKIRVVRGLKPKRGKS